VNYRFHINGWLGAEASYGYNRNTQQNFTPSGNFGIQSNVHQATGAVVVNVPVYVARMRPYVLAGAGALVFDPTSNTGGFVSAAAQQTRPAFVYGGGVDYRLVRHVALRLEYRGLYTTSGLRNFHTEFERDRTYRTAVGWLVVHF